MTPALSAPIVVCGVGRSGTSLLQSMLHAHPEVAFLPETHFFRRYVARARRRAALERAGVEALRNSLSQDTDFARAEIAPEDLLEAELSGENALDLCVVYRRLFGLAARRKGVERAGDKDPRALEHLDALSVALPHARVLHVVRDPRDVLVSRLEAAWSRSRPWWLQVLACREQLRRGRLAGRRAFGSAYLELRYEDLIRDAEGTLRRAAQHVGIAFDPAMLSFGDAARALVADDELSWKRETLGPLLTANSGKWSRDLSPWRADVTAAVCDETLRDFGYAPGDGPNARAARVLATPLKGAARMGYGLRSKWSA